MEHELFDKKNVAILAMFLLAGWTTHLKTYAQVKLDHFPKDRGAKKTNWNQYPGLAWQRCETYYPRMVVSLMVMNHG